MKVFTQEDPVGLVKRFDVGEYNGNKLPLIYEKVKNTVNPVNREPSTAFSVKVEKDGELFDVLDFDLDEVFDKGD